MKTDEARCLCRVLASILAFVVLSGDVSASETNASKDELAGSFEKNEAQANELRDWIVISKKPERIDAVDDLARTGEQSVRIEALAEKDAYQALVREIPVNDKEKYTFNVYVMNDRRSPLKGDIHAQLVIEWRDGYDKEISREWTRKWDQSLSRSRWKKYELKNLRPPKRAVKGILGVHVFEGVHGGKGAFYIDDITLTHR